jgi:multidrug efflux pump subunit AcrB
MESNSVNRLEKLRQLTLRTPEGATVTLDQVCDVSIEPSEVELVRDNLRQVAFVTGRLEGRDLGSAMKDIQATLAKDNWLPPGSVEYGGSFQQQQESFKDLLAVLVMAILLVFIVLLIEFRSFNEPISIVFGAVLAMFGTVAALWITGTTLNVVSFLGAIIGVGIVAKNGILMLDFVQHMEAESANLAEALVRSGHRRLRPVLMTSLAATLGMLPLAFGIGAGADMLRPLAVAVVGALCISVLLSLIATPVMYFVLRSFQRKGNADAK